VHPFAPAEQVPGYLELIDDLERWLARSPGTTRCRCSPTPARRASSPGCWRSTRTTTANGQAGRDVCLIPQSAHGTNAASAAMAGMRRGRRRRPGTTATSTSDDLRAKIAQHADRLGALMITYPSTHGVFEQGHRRDLRGRARGRRARCTSTAPTSTR
jgi:glycine dehydrogenase